MNGAGGSLRLPGSRRSGMRWGCCWSPVLPAGWLWMGIETLEPSTAPPSAPAGAEAPQPAAAAATDPFTLQVAAYLKQEYALKLVEELKRKGLDAYWTETSSGGKLWYQVRISHFPDQQAARELRPQPQVEGADRRLLRDRLAR
ncbi:MAG: SPOR domain-containing protein [Desulfobacterales bacterium]|nr:SPOR domain-containing protein [Desulfobacterales bacterium]